MNKKILILALHLGYGGVEKAITSLANSLAKLNKYEIEINGSIIIIDNKGSIIKIKNK